MLENDFFKAVSTTIFNLFKNELPANVIYHNFNHTLNVVNATDEIAVAEGVSESDREVLLLAAWFHDVGFIKGVKRHEEVGKKIARTYLTNIKYSEDKIVQVLACIDATKMPQKPINKLGGILCDADLFHLGTEEFNNISSLLRSEMEVLCGEEYTDIEWLEKNEKFLSEHTYKTDYAFQKLNLQKTSNWLKIQKDLKKLILKKSEQDVKDLLKLEEVKRKELKDNRPDRGIETMYRVTLKNHIKLSDIADTKANILLSVSAIIMSIALSTLFPKLDKPDNYYLIYPTMLFLLMSVVTMIFSILSTRPKVTSGKFSSEDVKNKKVNLLFFGNFHKMPLKEFQDGMEQVMNDRDYLYKSLMKDLYFLGKVLDKKYKLLRVAYNIFMVGIILSLLSFVIAFVLMKNSGIVV
ncbi:MAG: HD superfamily phosphodiesterase [Candidatus Azotimanducaceae bacterium]|jgi:HD superfamily phosphodiesterase